MEADLSAELPDEALVGTGLSLHPMETGGLSVEQGREGQAER